MQDYQLRSIMDHDEVAYDLLKVNYSVIVFIGQKLNLVFFLMCSECWLVIQRYVWLLDMLYVMVTLLDMIAIRLFHPRINLAMSCMIEIESMKITIWCRIIVNRSSSLWCTYAPFAILNIPVVVSIQQKRFSSFQLSHNWNMIRLMLLGLTRESFAFKRMFWIQERMTDSYCKVHEVPFLFLLSWCISVL